jgi:hypothetical protein
MGGFQGRGLAVVWLYCPGSGLDARGWRYSRELEVLSLGEAQACSGVAASRVRVLVLAGASLMAGAAVSVCGVVGFVGMAVPHLARWRLWSSSRGFWPGTDVGGHASGWSDIEARRSCPAARNFRAGWSRRFWAARSFCSCCGRSRRRGVDRMRGATAGYGGRGGAFGHRLRVGKRVMVGLLAPTAAERPRLLLVLSGVVRPWRGRRASRGRGPGNGAAEAATPGWWRRCRCGRSGGRMTVRALVLLGR